MSLQTSRWSLQQDRAKRLSEALFRILVHDAMSDFGHGAAALRVLDQPDQCLVRPCGMSWEEATASAMVNIGPNRTPVDQGSQ